MIGIDDGKLAQLRHSLEQRAGALRQEIEQTVERADVEKAQLLRDGVRDTGDESFVDLVADTNLAEVERDVNELRLVQAALQRMSAGEYGKCVDCDRDIDLKRLEVQPFAIRCIEHQEQHERMMSPAGTPTL